MIRSAALGAVLVAVAATVIMVRGSQPVDAATVFMCGQRLDLSDAMDTRAGLTMTVSSVRRASTSAGPGVAVRFTATSPLAVTSSPPTLFEVLYLRDGVIVGGGPMLNQQGDTSLQGLDLIGYGFQVGPDQPATLDLGPRDTLCHPLTWAEIWASPGSYEVAVLQGPAEGDAGERTLDIPAVGFPLLESRRVLGRSGRSRRPKQQGPV